MLTIRASRLHLVARCRQAAYLNPDHDINVSGDAAWFGTALHKLAEGNHSLEAVRSAYGLTEEQGKLLVEHLRYVPDSAKVSAIVRNELAIGYDVSDETGANVVGRVSGHIDRVVITQEQPNVAHVYDWKTGFVEVDEPDENLQMTAYALGAYYAWSEQVDSVEVSLIYTRTGKAMHAIYDATRLLQAQATLYTLFSTTTPDANFHPGAHCSMCPRRTSCPALNTWHEATGIPEGEIIERAVVWGKLSQQILDEAKMRMQANGIDSIPLPSGKRFAKGLRTTTTIDADAAWPIIKRAMPDTAHLAIASITLASAARALSMHKFMNGEKLGDKAAKDAVLAMLGDAASKTTTQYFGVINAAKDTDNE